MRQTTNYVNTNTLTEGQAAIVAYFEAVGRAIDDFHARVKAAGAPDVTNGVKIQRTALSWISHMRGAQDLTGSEAERLIDTKDVESYRTSLAAVWEGGDSFLYPYKILRAMIRRMDKDHTLQIGHETHRLWSLPLNTPTSPSACNLGVSSEADLADLLSNCCASHRVSRIVAVHRLFGARSIDWRNVRTPNAGREFTELVNFRGDSAGLTPRIVDSAAENRPRNGPGIPNSSGHRATHVQ